MEAFAPPSVIFSCQGQRQQVSFGQAFAPSLREGFSDAGDMSAMLQALDAGVSWREEVRRRYADANPWLYSIITSPRRHTFMEALVPPDGWVLDIGAGWGQMSLMLAKESRNVVALEPVTDRLSFIKKAALQDGVAQSIAFIGEDYLSCDFHTRFACILAIGVLEWAGAFHGDDSPREQQKRFLAKARRELDSNSVMILGIENRLGLKYLMGVPDDHIGVPGIACLEAPLAERVWHERKGELLRSFTYSHHELKELLLEAGFVKIEFFGALPDYKLTEVLLPLEENGAAFNEFLLSGEIPREHNGYDGKTLSDELNMSLQSHYKSLARMGIAHFFAPSFFVRATSAC